jgi:hypothetical protein
LTVSFMIAFLSRWDRARPVDHERRTALYRAALAAAAHSRIAPAVPGASIPDRDPDFGAGRA